MTHEKPCEELSDAQNYYLQAANLLKGMKHNDNAELAINYLTKSADLGLVEAQYQMGVMYSLGEHVAQSQPIAFDWFKKASDCDFIPAQFAMATLYSQSDQFGKAFDILNSLANKEVTEAQTNLADLYLRGKGVDKDVVKAISLLKCAANKGDRFAQYRLGQLYYQGQDTATDYVSARKYIVLAMEQKVLQAHFIMGSMLEHGFGIDKDVVRAYSLYCYCRHYGMPNLDNLIEDVLGTLDDIKKQQAKQKAQEYCEHEPSPI